VLRGLGRLATENSSISLNRRLLEDALTTDLLRAFSYVDWRLVLEKHVHDVPARVTEAQGLLCRMLQDKEAHATERVFRLLGILSPEHDVHTIYRGLAMLNVDVRASSLELLESFLPARFRSAVLALVDDVSDDDRIVAAGILTERAPADYEAVLRALLEVESSSIRSVAVYHVGEFGISRFAPAVQAMEAESDSALDVVVRQSVEWLKAPVPEGVT
jgi:HEAT repeat protein